MRWTLYSIISLFFLAMPWPEMVVAESSPRTSNPVVESFFLSRRDRFCGVHFVTETEYKRICIQQSERCGSSPVDWMNFVTTTSGEYCPGAFHDSGWPEALCPPNTSLKDAHEDSVGDRDPVCWFQRKLQMRVVCGIQGRDILSSCSSLIFGIDQARVDTAISVGTSPERALALLLNSYTNKQSLVSLSHRLLLSKAILSTYGTSPFETAAGQAKIYLDSLVSAPSEIEFAEELSKMGFILTP
jgi:hypothetical protein